MGITKQTHNFLDGGGEMGELIRAKDWSKTPLGPPETWPASLRTMVSVMLDNPFGMYIAWGKDYTQIYNDGYRPILGTLKHPQALGISTKKTFAEIWHIIGSMFDGVMEGEAVRFTDFMVSLNRNGYDEVCYFDFAYSPIRLDSGEVGGVLVTVIETTNKKNAEDGLKESKSEMEFIIENTQLGTFDYNPLTNKFSCNNRLKEWFGLPKENDIELYQAIEAVSKSDKQKVIDAVSKVLKNESDGNYDIEYTIENPITHRPIIVHAKGRAWYNDAMVAYRLTGTLEDVTERVLSRKKIEESERNLRLMILQAPVALAILRGDDYRVEIVNKLALDIWGRTEEQVLDTPLFEAMPELESQGIRALVDDVATTGTRFETSEMPVTFTVDNVNSIVYINFSFEPLYDIEGNINGVMAIGIDVTPQVEARKKIENSEQHMRALVESAPFPIGVYTGEDMRISLANQSIMDAWGKGNDVIGKSYPEILPELENQYIYEQIKNVYNTGIPFHAKNQKIDLVKNNTLSTYYFNYSFTPLLDSAGNVHAVMNTAADVTELHQAKQKVEDSEKKFRDSVMQAPLGIVIFRGPDHIVDMANDNYLQLINLKEEQFVDKPLFKSLPDVKTIMAPIISDVYSTGNTYYNYEVPISLNRNEKTEIGYYNFVYHPLNENNVITGIMVVITDITATVKAKNIIEENEEKLELIIEASDLGIFDFNIKSGDITVSDRCYEILGFRNQRNLSHQDLIAHHHPEDLPKRKTEMERALINGTLHYQARVIHDDQSVHWIDAKGKVYYDDQNNPERMLGTVRDITEERSFQQQLLEREEKFRLLADSMPQHVWTSDPNGEMTYFNQSVYEYSGLTPGQIKSEGWIQIVHPDERQENIRQWLLAVKTGEDFLMEHRFRKYDGEYRWQLSRAIPQRDSEGNITMWVGSSTDIQEQKMFTTELEHKVQLRTSELQQKNRDLENINKELQSFVYISSHDLQEPLRKIQTFSSRILETEYDHLSDNAKKHFSRMQKSAQRMQNLIQDLIAYSRTNVEVSNYERKHLLEVIEEVQETLSEELGQDNVSLKLHNICDVHIIPVQFNQVMQNLISNSIKFARADQPLVIEINCDEVTGDEAGIISLSKDTLYSHIEVKDNGIGFESQYSNKIFEVFQRLHSKDDYSGTGIGLAIVKKIIENHEGIILAKGRLNEGAVFDIYIPVR